MATRWGRISSRIAVVGLLFLPTLAPTSEMQIHTRTGALKGVFFGPPGAAGEFLITSALDMEYEIFLHNRRSFFLRSIMGMDFSTLRPYYTYAGAGMHFYFDSKGRTVDESGSGFVMSSRPLLRYYWGFDLGFAYALTKVVTKVLSVISSMVDGGPHLGMSYMVDRNFGLETQLGITGVYGISSVSVTGYTWRVFIGMSYMF